MILLVLLALLWLWCLVQLHIGFRWDSVHACMYSQLATGHQNIGANCPGSSGTVPEMPPLSLIPESWPICPGATRLHWPSLPPDLPLHSLTPPFAKLKLLAPFIASLLSLGVCFSYCLQISVCGLVCNGLPHPFSLTSSWLLLLWTTSEKVLLVLFLLHTIQIQKILAS